VVELVVGVLLSTAAVYYVLRPIFRPETAVLDRDAIDVDADLEDDASPRAQALRALREIEFDRATGKLSDADYEALRAQYTAQALAALRGETRPAAGTALPPSPFPLPACPVDGPRPEAGAVFCSACGRRLDTGPGYCVRCGTALENGARFCSRCGTGVAA
jgi:hypothetical protein